MPRPPMRVLIVCPWASRAGHYWPNTVALAAALSRKGVRIDIVAPGQNARDGLAPEVTLHSVSIFSTLRRATRSEDFHALLGVLTAQWATHACLRQTSFDCVHFIDGRTISSSLLAVLSERCAIINSTYGFPESSEERAKRRGVSLLFLRLRDWLVRRAVATGRMALICETPKVLEAFQPTYASHVYEIPYSIAETEGSVGSCEARKRLGLPEDRFIFLLFGTHRMGKDYGTVLKALGKTEDRAMAFFSGALISANNPHTLAKTLPAERTAFLDGFLSDETMALCFTAADFVVIPYEGGFERGSGVLLEACRYRRPVIATDTGYLRSFVEENGVGLLYTPGDGEGLSRVMREAMQPESRSRFAAALEATAQRHSWDVSVHRYLDLYRRYSVCSCSSL